eukprot:gene19889-23795_t
MSMEGRYMSSTDARSKDNAIHELTTPATQPDAKRLSSSVCMDCECLSELDVGSITNTPLESTMMGVQSDTNSVPASMSMNGRYMLALPRSSVSARDCMTGFEGLVYECTPHHWISTSAGQAPLAGRSKEYGREDNGAAEDPLSTTWSANAVESALRPARRATKLNVGSEAQEQAESQTYNAESETYNAESQSYNAESQRCKGLSVFLRKERGTSVSLQQQELCASRNVAFDILIWGAEATLDLTTAASMKLDKWCPLYLLLGVIVGSSLTLVGHVVTPHHIPWQHPDYWWECITVCSTVWCVMLAAFIVTHITFLLTLSTPFPRRGFIIVLAVGSLTDLVTWLVVSCTYSAVQGPPYPMPFIGLGGGFTSGLSMAFSFVYLMTACLKRNDEFKSRLRAVLKCTTATCVVTIGYIVLLCFITAAKKYQDIEGWHWIAVVLVVGYPDVVQALVLKLAFQAAGSDDASVHIVVGNLLTAVHSSFICMCMTMLPTHLCIALLVAEIIKNLRIGLTAVALHKLADAESQEQINLLRIVLFLVMEYGKILCAAYAFVFELWFCINAVACGIDLTFQFKWLRRKEWQPGSE